MRAFFVAILILLSSGGVRAEGLEAGNELYKQGDFEAAAQRYESLLKKGLRHQDLFYNLGNAYFRLGELGPAIYNYERALRLSPNMEDATFNMAIARDVVSERIPDRFRAAEIDPFWVRAATRFTMGELTVFLLVTNALFFVGLILLRFLTPGFRRTAMFVTNAFVGLSLLGALVLFVLAAVYFERVEVGIVLEDQVVMREGTGEQLAERGTLHAGLRVEVVEERAGWVRVRLSTGNEGWVPGGSIGRL